MKDLNDVMLVGRLVRDAELKYFQSGSAFSELSIACNRTKKEQDGFVDEANFFNVAIYGKTAENLNQYLKKGCQLVVHGELKQERWSDKEGNKQQKVVIVANEIQLVGSRPNSGSAPKSSPAPKDNEPQKENSDGSFPEDIPF